MYKIGYLKMFNPFFKEILGMENKTKAIDWILFPLRNKLLSKFFWTQFKFQNKFFSWLLSFTKRPDFFVTMSIDFKGSNHRRITQFSFELSNQSICLSNKARQRSYRLIHQTVSRYFAKFVFLFSFHSKESSPNFFLIYW